MFWLKTIGIALVIAGCGGGGLMGARKIDKRVEQIKTARQAMGYLEKEITYLQTPLSLALEHTADMTPPPLQVLFKESARCLLNRQGASVTEAWQGALTRLRQQADLHEEDLLVLQTAATQLGASGIEQQKQYFLLLQEQLRIQEEKARGKAASERKLWSYGGFIVGTAVVLFLL
jgi:stage III sporulation protein AB